MKSGDENHKKARKNDCWVTSSKYYTDLTGLSGSRSQTKLGSGSFSSQQDGKLPLQAINPHATGRWTQTGHNAETPGQWRDIHLPAVPLVGWLHHQIFPQVCQAILAEFQVEYLYCRDSPDEWKRVKFRTRWNVSPPLTPKTVKHKVGFKI